MAQRTHRLIFEPTLNSPENKENRKRSTVREKKKRNTHPLYTWGRGEKGEERKTKIAIITCRNAEEREFNLKKKLQKNSKSYLDSGLWMRTDGEKNCTPKFRKGLMGNATQ